MQKYFTPISSFFFIFMKIKYRLLNFGIRSFGSDEKNNISVKFSEKPNGHIVGRASSSFGLASSEILSAVTHGAAVREIGIIGFTVQQWPETSVVDNGRFVELIRAGRA